MYTTVIVTPGWEATDQRPKEVERQQRKIGTKAEHMEEAQPTLTSVHTTVRDRCLSIDSCSGLQNPICSQLNREVEGDTPKSTIRYETKRTECVWMFSVLYMVVLWGFPPSLPILV